MSATAEFYLSIICNAGLDPEDEKSWDRLTEVLKSKPSDITLPVDEFDYAVDELMREQGYYSDERTVSLWDTLVALYWAVPLTLLAAFLVYVAVSL